MTLVGEQLAFLELFDLKQEFSARLIQFKLMKAKMHSLLKLDTRSRETSKYSKVFFKQSRSYFH